MAEFAGRPDVSDVRLCRMTAGRFELIAGCPALPRVFLFLPPPVSQTSPATTGPHSGSSANSTSHLSSYTSKEIPRMLRKVLEL